jgi:hypothetical protein
MEGPAAFHLLIRRSMMTRWITSRNGAVTITALTILSEAWRSFLDAMFILPVDFNDPLYLHMAALLFALLFGGWIWALALAWQGSRRALVVTFVLNLVVLLGIPVSWLFFYCPAACRADAGIFNLANTLNLVLGLLAAVTLGRQLRRPAPEVGA